MTRPTWLFEADVFGRAVEPFQAEIRRQGMVCHVTRQSMLANGTWDLLDGRTLDEIDCVIACGCYPFVRHVQDHRQWVPGAWCNSTALACSAYYPHFAPYLLNRRHHITNGVDAIRDSEALFAELGRQGQLFVRPDGCQKTFTGRVVEKDDFEAALAPARYDPSTCVVVAEPRPIGREWRVVVVDGRPVTAGLYLVDGVIRTQPGCPPEVMKFTQDMLSAIGWQPDDVFMADVCESGAELFLLELNSFNSSAVYPCDYRAVVEAVSGLAVRAWQRR